MLSTIAFFLLFVPFEFQLSHMYIVRNIKILSSIIHLHPYPKTFDQKAELTFRIKKSAKSRGFYLQ